MSIRCDSGESTKFDKRLKGVFPLIFSMVSPTDLYDACDVLRFLHSVCVWEREKQTTRKDIFGMGMVYLC